jgi:hypothetical protein
MLKVVTIAEIERIFEILDRLGISREAVEIPLRPDHPGQVRRLASGKLRIVVESEGELEAWLSGLEQQLRTVAAGG